MSPPWLAISIFHGVEVFPADYLTTLDRGESFLDLAEPAANRSGGRLPLPGTVKRPRWRRREVRSLQVDKTSFTPLYKQLFFITSSADPERVLAFGTTTDAKRDIKPDPANVSPTVVKQARAN